MKKSELLLVCDQNEITIINPSQYILRMGEKCGKGKILVTDYANRQNYDFGIRKLDYYETLLTLELP